MSVLRNRYYSYSLEQGMTSHRSLLEGQPETVDDRAHTATCHVRM